MCTILLLFYARIYFPGRYFYRIKHIQFFKAYTGSKEGRLCFDKEPDENKSCNQQLERKKNSERFYLLIVCHIHWPILP